MAAKTPGTAGGAEKGKRATGGENARGLLGCGDRPPDGQSGSFNPSNRHRRLFRLVLLALAGPLLSRWNAHGGMVFTLRETISNGRVERPFLLMADGGHSASWLRAIGRRRFLYTVKVSELITHVRRFEGTKTLIRDFGHIADLLDGKMGCLLYQLPPSFHYTPARLARIVGQLELGRRNVVEFRHASWWNERVFAAFRAAGIIFCCCSAPRLPDTLVQTAPEIYLRFHGTRQWYRHDYSRTELMPWVRKIQEGGAGRVWAYFNNDREGYALKNARLFRRLLGSPRYEKT